MDSLCRTRVIFASRIARAIESNCPGVVTVVLTGNLANGTLSEENNKSSVDFVCFTGKEASGLEGK